MKWKQLRRTCPSIQSRRSGLRLTRFRRTSLSLATITSKLWQVFKDSVERGVFQEISKEEDAAYDSPKFYINMVEAFKQSSKSTPLRICMNSSMKFMGKSLNTIMSKGPAALNCLIDVLLSWRLFPVAFTKDIAKFYNSVDSVEHDYVHRIIWCFKIDEPLRTYITKVVHCGDCAAGSITMLCL